MCGGRAYYSVPGSDKGVHAEREPERLLLNGNHSWYDFWVFLAGDMAGANCQPPAIGSALT